MGTPKANCWELRVEKTTSDFSLAVADGISLCLASCVRIAFQRLGAHPTRVIAFIVDSGAPAFPVPMKV